MEEEKKIGALVVGSLLLFAVSIDAIQFVFDLFTAVPVIGWLLGPPIVWFFTFFGGVILSSWFYYLEVNFIGRMGVAILIEAIPVLNGVPAFTAATLLTILAANDVAFGAFVRSLVPGAGRIQKASAGKEAAAAALAAPTDEKTKSAQATRSQPPLRGAAQVQSAGMANDGAQGISGQTIAQSPNTNMRDTSGSSGSTMESAPTQRFADIQPRGGGSTPAPRPQKAESPVQKVRDTPEPGEQLRRSFPSPQATPNSSEGVNQPERDMLKEKYEKMREDLPEELRKAFIPFDLLTTQQVARMKAVVDATERMGKKLGEAVRTNQRLGPALENHHRRLSTLESQIQMLENNREKTPQLQREIDALKGQYAEESEAYTRTIEKSLEDTPTK